MNAADIIQLAKLPGRNQLLTMLLGSMNAPISSFVGILGGLLGGFVRVLNAYKDKLPPDAPKA
jgi:large subunit ribosomal protein L10